MNNMINFLPCGYIKLAIQGIIEDVNDTFLEMTGYEKKDLIGMHFESFLSIASKIIFHSLFFPEVCMKGRIDELYLTLKNKNKDDLSILLVGKKREEEIEGVDCIIVRSSKRDNYEKELKDIKEELESAYIAENKLRRLFETILYSMQEGLVVTDNHGKITIINQLAARYTGCTEEIVIGKDFHEVFSSISRIDSGERLDIIQGVLKGEKEKEIVDEVFLVSKDGNETYISGTVAAMINEREEVSGTVFSFRDITKEYLQEKEIKSFLNINMEMLCVIDELGKYHNINKKFEMILGYSPEDIIGKNFLSFIHPEDISVTASAIKSCSSDNELCAFTNRYRCKDGTYRYIEWYRQSVIGKYIYSSARDITDKMEKEAKLLQIAVKDELTGLYNRHFLMQYIEKEIENAKTEGYPITMAILDLDKFKAINDTWGHPVGDEQLKHTANIILEVIRSTDLLVRFGGEEFIIVFPKTDIVNAKVVLEKIRFAIEKSHHPITGKQTVSLGGAQWIKSEAFVDWYKRADEALYNAKNSGRNCVKVCI